MRRKQTYSLKSIRRSYTYSVYEIAELYNITPDTVFRWIRNEGLKRHEGSPKYYVHGSELIKFFEARNLRNKKPCGEGEMFCCKCKQPRHPKPESLRHKKIPNKTIRVFGKCSVCGTRMNTVVSGKKWSKNHPFHPDRDASTKGHNVEQGQQRECQTPEGEETCPNITL